MTQVRTRGIEGWRVTGLIGAMLAVMTMLLIPMATQQSDAIRLVIRATARTSLILFMLAFSAAALAQLSPVPAVGWLRRNRRYIGVGFALSHLLHAAAIIKLAQSDPVLFDALTSPASFIFGGVAYGFIIAMLATSFDSTARAIGPLAWQRLHTTGSWFLWLMFVINFGKRAPLQPSYWSAIVIALLALFIRLVAWRKARIATSITTAA